jgi:anaphase-promoting complex subunit 11
MPFDGCPPEGKFPGDDSPVVWGICSHSFHLQCINRWLSTQAEQKCPFCRRAWEFKQADVATTTDQEGEQGGNQ